MQLTTIQKLLVLNSHLFEDYVDGTANVDVNKVYVSLRIDELGTSCHRVNVSPTYLHTKQVLRLVSLNKSPLTLLTL